MPSQRDDTRNVQLKRLSEVPDPRSIEPERPTSIDERFECELVSSTRLRILRRCLEEKRRASMWKLVWKPRARRCTSHGRRTGRVCSMPGPSTMKRTIASDEMSSRPMTVTAAPELSEAEVLASFLPTM